MIDKHFGYLYIFDYSSSTIYEIELTEEDYNFTSTELLNKYNLKESNCNFMCSENKLELKPLKN